MDASALQGHVLVVATKLYGLQNLADPLKKKLVIPWYTLFNTLSLLTMPFTLSIHYHVS